MSRPPPRGPLAGLTVLELGSTVAGPFCGRMLADFGADVVKVEPREGDTLRGWKVEGVETAWKLQARNKRSLAIEFRHAGAVDLLRRLVPRFQVLVESFRPGTLEEMGLGPDVLLALNPKLIVVRVSGWGQTGPYSPRPGFGTLVEGFSGFADMNGFADREPVLPPMYLADSLSGLTGAFAVMAALREVEVNGGKGQVIDMPLLDPMLHALGPQAANWRLSGRIKQRTGSRSTQAGPRNVYRTKDGGWVCLSASTQGMAERVMASIGRADLIENPKFKTNAARVANAPELDAIIGAFVGERTLAENVAFFEQAEVTIGPVNNISAVVADRHVIDRALIADYPDADMGAFPMHSITARMSGTPGTVRTPAPRLGQDTRAVLAEAGMSAAEIDAAISSGLAKVPK